MEIKTYSTVVDREREVVYSDVNRSEGVRYCGMLVI